MDLKLGCNVRHHWLIASSSILIATAVSTSETALAQGNTNMQGVSGLFNVPDASVIEFGKASLSFDRQVDGRTSADPRLNDSGNDIVFGAGVFPHVEVAGRNVTGESTSGSSDLSFNMKLQSPWQLFDGLDLAIGQMDVGGSVNEYDTTYAVATWQFGDVRATLGGGKVTGKATNYTLRLDGAFGGIEYAPTDWFSVMLEDDGHSRNAGVRLGVPKAWLPEGWQLSTLLMGSSEEGADGRKDWYGFNLQIPLAQKVERTLPKSRPRKPAEKMQHPVVIEEVYGTEQRVRITSGPDFDAAGPGTASDDSTSPRNKQSDRLNTGGTSVQYSDAQIARDNPMAAKARRLRSVMVKAGFERVRVARTGPRWIIAFENPRYNANVVDGLGVAAGLISHQLADNEFFYLQLEKYGLPVFGLGGHAPSWQRFLAGETAMPPSEMTVAPRNELQRDTNMIRHAAKSTLDYLAFRPTITVRPAISSTIGTEFGVFDYSLATRVDVVQPLWPGAAINITRDWSTYETDDFTEDGRFGGVFLSQAIEDGVKNKVFSQAIRHGGGFTSMVSYGEFLGQYEGVQYEGRWEPGDGRHRFQLVAADLEDMDFPEDVAEPLLASWRYFAQRTNTEFNITTGRFLEGDEGFKADITQHVGNMQLHLIVKESENDQFAGIGFTLPLTPQRDMKRIAGVQVVGTPYFRYEVSTILGQDNGNPLVFGPNRQPEQSYNLGNAFYNGDRLSPAYVTANQERMQQAWQKYGKPRY